MGWADDMYSAGYTSEHGGLMDRSGSGRSYSGWSKKKNNVTRTSNNYGKSWSTHARNQVALQYSKGKSVEAIANEFKRTPYAIAWQLFNFGMISAPQRDSYK